LRIEKISLMSREELRAVCDKEKTKEKILAALRE